jgi:large subunit ribosomal protein L25
MAAKNDTTKLDVTTREPHSSRETRRLRRSGRVPGVLYGKGGDPVPFDTDERALRHALAASGAVVDVCLDGGTSEAAVLKDAQRHPVRGELMHVDLLRVDLNKPIHAMVPIHLVGNEEAPGVKEGGVLEHVTREVNVEALPNDIPEFIELDVSQMNINDTLTLSAASAIVNVTLLDDPDETTIATLSPPRLVTEDEEIESETEVVGEGEEGAEGEAAADSEGGGDDAAGSGDSDGE